jgi:hypothetical protein
VWLKIKPHLPQKLTSRPIPSWAVAAAVVAIIGAMMLLSAPDKTGAAAVTREAAVPSPPVTAPAPNPDQIETPEPIAAATVESAPPLEAIMEGPEVIPGMEAIENEPQLSRSAPSSTETQPLESDAPEFSLQPPATGSTPVFDLQSESAMSLSLTGSGALVPGEDKAAPKAQKKSITRSAQKKRGREERSSTSFIPVDRIRRSVQGFVHRIF